ncbi:ankyrin repeat domain-containing protein [Pseudoalteromonas sp. OFAV1]|jgi:ankyrin repeat protein|uniref:ankyrin repeat domain-containing protein n=1 Tax=Pseudoalteromonas sp. OFAV1 TaxID=2908892 RepID=UPI001F295E14|nr:ankyrin repeat domain-containing protein [Pseudoalteromonas sp. OFAV1]MCF2900899.1 ankyrin repeat domain-containing protein [Pseudoalteromonas sp. OFAV1]
MAFVSKVNSFSNSSGNLISAAQSGNERLVAEIIASQNYTKDEYRAALMKSAGHGHLSLTKGLAELSDNDIPCSLSATRMASQFGHTEILEYFLTEKHIDPNINGGMLAEVAAQYNRLNSLKSLSKFGFNFKANAGTAFQKAVHYLHVDSIVYLLESGAPFTVNARDSELKNNSGYQQKSHSFDIYDAINRMAAKGDEFLDVFVTLIEKRDLDFTARSAAMVRASSYGQVKLMKYLLNNGADINYEKVAALSEAVRFNQLEAVSYILKNTDYDKHIGLQRALKKANDFQVKYDANRGGDADGMTRLILREILNEGNSMTLQSMVIRCLNGKQWRAAIDIVEFNPDILDNVDILNRIIKFGKDRSLMEVVISNGIEIKPEYIDVALEYGNGINALTLLDEGVLPVNLNESMANAAKYGHLDILKLLVLEGADVTYDKSRAVNLACQHNHKDVVSFLESKGEMPSDDSKEIARMNLMQSETKILHKKKLHVSR